MTTLHPGTDTTPTVKPAHYKNIFLADDDSDDREIFIDALRVIDSSILCVYATDGEKALQLLSGDILEKPDLIFLDLNMPRLNGKNLLRKMREIDTLRYSHVVMYSTFFNDQDLAEFRKMSAKHLIKPPAFDQLVFSLSQILTTPW